MSPHRIRKCLIFQSINQSVKANNTDSVNEFFWEQDTAKKHWDLPLHIAINNNLIAALRLLLKAGAYPNASNSQGVRPLRLAIDRQNPRAVSVLLEEGASPTEKSYRTQERSLCDHAFGDDDCVLQFARVNSRVNEKRLTTYIHGSSNAKILEAFLLGGFPFSSESIEKLKKVDEYKKKIESSSLPNLQRQCRRKIRSILRGNLAYEVECLPITEVLKEYLLLSEFSLGN